MPSSSDVIASSQALNIFQWLFFAGLTLNMTVFGTLANIINIVCLLKQGFRDTINISFLGLAISDLCCLVPLIWSNICFIPSFIQLELPFEPIEFQYLTGSTIHVMFSRVTSWMTAFITMARCLCIVMPLKVKTMLTQRHVTAIIVCIFTLLISSMLPSYNVNRLFYKFSPSRNRTLIGLMFTPDRVFVETILFATNNVFLQFTSFIAVLVFTIAIIIKLRTTSEWRKTASISGQNNRSTSREQRITKMVVAVSTVFIVCFFPVCLISIGMICEPEFSIQGTQKNFFSILTGVAFFLESVNSSVNIFIYYHMSSKYRTAFRQIILRRDE